MAVDIPECFKAYDIRGRYPEQLDVPMAEAIGRVLADYFSASKIVVGHDLRHSSLPLAQALIKGIKRMGANVLYIGRSLTEEVYFTVADHDCDAGVMITASHNPVEYNGMKIVSRQSEPVSSDNGLWEIGELVAKGQFAADAAQPGEMQQLDNRMTYVLHLLKYFEVTELKPLKLVLNPGNSGAGEIIDRMEMFLPYELVRINWQADGSFPKGVPNPMLKKYRQETAQAVRDCGADMGLAWDGDCDRCFFFDERGQFIESYYLVGLLAEYFLSQQQYRGQSVICDTRLIWNTQDVVAAAGGNCIVSKAGHSFIKQKMRENQAVYGGEMSAHHYFKDFFYCDSGMLPWLVVAKMLSAGVGEGLKLSQLVETRQQKFPVSGELSRRTPDHNAVMADIKEHFRDSAKNSDEIDGLSMEFADWRFNLRPSNTEPLLRLNVESRGDRQLLEQMTSELLAMIGGEEAD